MDIQKQTSKKTPTTIDDDMIAMDETFDFTQELRKSLSKKLTPLIETMVIDPTDTEKTTAQMSVMAKHMANLDALDRAAVSRTNTKLKKLDTETNSELGAQLVAAITKIKDTSSIKFFDGTTDLSKTQIEMATRFSDLEKEIPDTATRTDPKDLK